MDNLQKNDFFTNNPIQQFVGAGFEKYRPRRQWERNLANASFYFIADGSLEFQFKNSSFSADKGDVVFLKKRDIAVIKNTTDSYSSLYYIAFNYDEDMPLEISTHFTETPYHHLFKDILDTHRSMAPYSSLKINYHFNKLIYSLMMDTLQTKKEYIQNSRINAAAEYININYYKNITIEKLCDITGYSPAHLRRLFNSHFGTSPQNYILDKRIDIAKELLIDTPEKSIDEIKDLVGMNSASYFCKLFKEKLGCSPLNFRKMISDENE